MNRLYCDTSFLHFCCALLPILMKQGFFVLSCSTEYGCQKTVIISHDTT